MTERELSWGAARRLAIIQHVEEVTGNVAMTCRYFGITRHTYYRWFRRYQQLGLEGLKDRSHRPLVCPHATKAEVVGKIIHLRQHYHFGPAKISMYLKRYHDVSVSPSGIWRILKRANLNRLPASQRYNATPNAGNGMRSNSLGTRSRSTSSSSSPSRVFAKSTISTPLSMTAPGCEFSRSSTAWTRRLQSDSLITSSRSFLSKST